MRTMKESVRLPIAQLKRRVSPCALEFRTSAHRPETFAQVLGWEPFLDDAVNRFEALDDKIRRHLPQVRSSCKRDCMKVCCYSDTSNAGFNEVFGAHICIPQISNHVLAKDGNLSACQTVHSAADESEVRGYIYRVLEPLSNLAPMPGLHESANLVMHNTEYTSRKCAADKY